MDWKADQMLRTGVTNVLRPAWARAMLSDLLARGEGEARGLMLTLWAGDTLMAGHFGLRVGKAYHPWMAAMNPDHAAHSPGQTFLLRAISAMAELGLDAYDLATGHGYYKRPFCNAIGTVRSGVFTADGGAPLTLRDDAIGRLARRFDHVSSVELTLGGRIHAMGGAIARLGARMRSRAGDDAAEIGA